MPLIKDFPVVLVSPDHNDKYRQRKLNSERILNEIGFKQITHFKSGTEQYPECLANAFIEILESHLDDDEPILIVEDDIGWSGVSEIDVPDNVDAIYIGNSILASHPTLPTNVAYCQLGEYSDTQLRVYNMLGMHAILYISNIYKQKTIEMLKQCRGTTMPLDILISRIQKDFTVLVNKNHVFFQDDGENKSVTQVDFDIKNGNFCYKMYKTNIPM